MTALDRRLEALRPRAGDTATYAPGCGNLEKRGVVRAVLDGFETQPYVVVVEWLEGWGRPRVEVVEPMSLHVGLVKTSAPTARVTGPSCTRS